MPTPAKVFLTGATGYTGGSILTTLLKHPEKYEISTLVRNQTQAETLQKLGVTPILGDLDDSDFLTKCAKNSHAVVHAANCDHAGAPKAFIQGLKSKGDGHAVYVHTSGTVGVMTPGPNSEVPYDDEDIQRIRSRPPTAPNQDIDAWIFDNSQEIKSAIIAPSTINGVGIGPFRKISIQVPALVQAAVERKQAGWVGNRNDVIWGNVNILDLAELYRLVLDGLLSKTIESGGFYFGSTTEHSWGKIGESMGIVLHKMGLVNTPEAAQFGEEFRDKYFYGEVNAHFFEGDVGVIGNRSRRIGWKPSHPNIFETLEDEVKYMLEIGEIH